MSHTNKKKKELQKKRGATFVGLRPQYFRHKDDKDVIRRAGKKEIRKYQEEEHRNRSDVLFLHFFKPDIILL